MSTEKRQKRFPNLLKGAKAAEENSGKAAKGRGRPFGKGKSGNPKGRPAGVPNKVTREAKDFAELVLHNADVQARIIEDAQKGRLPPAVLTMLMSYAWGKPKETIKHEGLERLLVEVTDRDSESRQPDENP